APVTKGDDRLRRGMFVNVTVVFPEATSRVVVPATGVSHASFRDSVFIVEPRKDDKGNPVPGPDGKPGLAARQQFVRVGETRGDYVANAHREFKARSRMGAKWGPTAIRAAHRLSRGMHTCCYGAGFRTGDSSRVE